MAPEKNSGINQNGRKILAPIMLSAAFIAASGALLYGAQQVKHETDKLRDSREKLAENIDQMRDSLNETQKQYDEYHINVEQADNEITTLGRRILDTHCTKAFKAVIENGQIPAPVTKEALLEANISINVPYNDERPLAEMSNWVESHGPEYQVTDGKLDCGYLLRRGAPAP